MTAFALAVIDAQIADCRATGHTGNVENLLAARAELAELVEADRELDAALAAKDRHYDDWRALEARVQAAAERRAAALANVTGGAV